MSVHPYAVGLAILFAVVAILLLFVLVERMQLSKTVIAQSPTDGVRGSEFQSSLGDVAKLIDSLNKLTLTLDRVGPSAFLGFFVVLFLIGSLVSLGIAAYASHP